MAAPNPTVSSAAAATAAKVLEFFVPVILLSRNTPRDHPAAVMVVRWRRNIRRTRGEDQSAAPAARVRPVRMKKRRTMYLSPNSGRIAGMLSIEDLRIVVPVEGGWAPV